MALNDDKRVENAAPPADAGGSPLERLHELGVRGILRQLAQDGQLLEVRCEMP